MKDECQTEYVHFFFDTQRNDAILFFRLIFEILFHLRTSKIIQRKLLLMGHALMGGGQLPHFCSGKKFSVKLQCTERNLYQVLLKFCFLSFINKNHTFWHLEAPLLPQSKCGSWHPPLVHGGTIMVSNWARPKIFTEMKNLDLDCPKTIFRCK